MMKPGREYWIGTARYFLVGLSKNGQVVLQDAVGGVSIRSARSFELDAIIVPIKKTFWYNVYYYKTSKSVGLGPYLYDTKDDARKSHEELSGRIWLDVTSTEVEMPEEE